MEPTAHVTAAPSTPAERRYKLMKKIAITLGVVAVIIAGAFGIRKLVMGSMPDGNGVKTEQQITSGAEKDKAAKLAEAKAAEAKAAEEAKALEAKTADTKNADVKAMEAKIADAKATILKAEAAIALAKRPLTEQSKAPESSVASPAKPAAEVVKNDADGDNEWVETKEWKQSTAEGYTSWKKLPLNGRIQHVDYRLTPVEIEWKKFPDSDLNIEFPYGKVNQLPLLPTRVGDKWLAPQNHDPGIAYQWTYITNPNDAPAGAIRQMVQRFGIAYGRELKKVAADRKAKMASAGSRRR